MWFSAVFPSSLCQFCHWHSIFLCCKCVHYLKGVRVCQALPLSRLTSCPNLLLVLSASLGWSPQLWSQCRCALWYIYDTPWPVQGICARQRAPQDCAPRHLETSTNVCTRRVPRYCFLLMFVLQVVHNDVCMNERSLKRVCIVLRPPVFLLLSKKQFLMCIFPVRNVKCNIIGNMERLTICCIISSLICWHVWFEP